MHPIAAIGGAGKPSGSCWARQKLKDPTIFHLEYERGNLEGCPWSESGTPALMQYAKRILPGLLEIDAPSVDVLGHSMGGPLAIAVTGMADKIAPGKVRNVILVTSGVFGGPTPCAFHRMPGYGWFTDPAVKRRTDAAVSQIRLEIPGFKHEVSEHLQAMLEAGDGVIHIPEGFDRRRIKMYIVRKDEVIPEKVSRFVAKREGVQLRVIEGDHYHLVPLHDIYGTVLAGIRADNP